MSQKGLGRQSPREAATGQAVRSSQASHSGGQPVRRPIISRKATAKQSHKVAASGPGGRGKGPPQAAADHRGRAATEAPRGKWGPFRGEGAASAPCAAREAARGGAAAGLRVPSGLAEHVEAVLVPRRGSLLQLLLVPPTGACFCGSFSFPRRGHHVRLVPVPRRGRLVRLLPVPRRGRHADLQKGEPLVELSPVILWPRRRRSLPPTTRRDLSRKTPVRLAAHDSACPPVLILVLILVLLVVTPLLPHSSHS